MNSDSLLLTQTRKVAQSSLSFPQPPCHRLAQNHSPDGIVHMTTYAVGQSVMKKWSLKYEQATL